MNYKRFYMKINPVDNLIRRDKQGSDILCRGYEVEIFDSEEKLSLTKFQLQLVLKF